MSSTAKIPIAMPKSVSTRSTCSGVAPSSTRNCASYMYGKHHPVADEARPLPTTTPTLSQPLRQRRARWRARRAAVAPPRTISSSRITAAGLKKCRPTTAAGREVTDAIASMSSVDVFVARMQPGLRDASSSRRSAASAPAPRTRPRSRGRPGRARRVVSVRKRVDARPAARRRPPAVRRPRVTDVS